MGETKIEPVDNEILFMHCSNNQLSVSKRVFDKRVKPMLEVHGIKFVEMVKND